MLGPSVFGMDRAGVVHLQEGFGEDLPVATELDVFDVDHPKRRFGHLGQQPRQRIQPLEQRPGVRIEVDEVPAAPGLGTHRWKAPFALVEIDEVALVGYPNQLPCQVVAPRVELTCQHARRSATAAHDRRAPMAARVVEGAHHAILPTSEQNRSTNDVAQLVAAGAWELGVMSGIQPHPLEQVLMFQLLEHGVGVTPERQVPQSREPLGRAGTRRLIRRTLPKLGQVRAVHRSTITHTPGRRKPPDGETRNRRQQLFPRQGHVMPAWLHARSPVQPRAAATSWAAVRPAR